LKTRNRNGEAVQQEWFGDEHRSLAQDAFRRLRRNRLAMFGLIVVGLLMLITLAAPLVAPHDPVAMEPEDALQGPSITYLLGTDELGRDLLSRIIFGCRTSLSVGIISVGLALAVGTILGLVSGYYLGAADMIISRIMEILYAFPPILLALVIIALLGTGIDKAMIAVGIVLTPAFGRVCRGAVLAERTRVYVDAARVSGASDLRILWRHIMPNIVSPIIVNVTLCMSYAILTEAALSYMGLGTQPPTPSWGVMLNKGRTLMPLTPWVSIWPGLAIMAVVFAFNVLGDGLRDALDPRLIGKR
jgi:peptide/nickel transport system permease protein